ncbi:MAG: hypothetical protein M5U14_22140 [Acidimicrobiia bacterium]|nr:hypothetical protein [Acidimicrobiia bacterium]
MSQRAQRFLEAARRPVPEGTFAVGAGLLVAGLTAYGFQILAFRALSKESYAALNGLWVIVFVAAPGFFLPLEQEVGRALAHRRAQGLGGGPLVKRAAVVGGAVTLALVVAALLGGQALVDNLFNHEGLLLAGFVVALVAYSGEHLARGTLSGNGRFGPYGLMLGSEGVIRLAACAVLFAVGLTSPGPYGLVLAGAPIAAIAVSMFRQRGLVTPGPDAPWSELSSALGYLLAGSVFAQTLGYAAFLGASVLATSDERDALGGFIAGLFIARIPILLFQAVQAALLPKLAGLAGSGRYDDFRAGLRKLVVIVVGIGVIGVLGGLTLGPWAGELLFGSKFTLGNRDLALLAAGSGAFILALTIAQALIALGGHAQAVLAWLAGIVGFLVVTALGSDLFLRVEMGFLAGSLASVGMMTVLLAARLRAGAVPSPEILVEALEAERLGLGELG